MSTEVKDGLDITKVIIETKECSKEYNEYQKYIVDNEVLVNSCEEMQEKSKEIYETLLNSPVREDGGRNALFGFYYQFLIAIDYLIDIGERKWDFMAIEIHDDIVLCKENSERPTVRFVQVKTSKNPTVSYSSTELCNRNQKKFGEGEEKQERRINDSWLDKLFSNAEMFKDKLHIKQEFQLVTNFTFYVSLPQKSETKNIRHYRMNDSFEGIEIKDDDPFYKKLREPTYDLNGMEYNYQSKAGMTVRELLEKTQISERVDYLSSFRDGIVKRIGEFLSRKIKVDGGATILDEDINWLIGEMCASCAARDDKLVLFINQEKADEIIYKLLQRSKVYSEKFNQVMGNKQFIDEAFEKIICNIGSSHPEAISDLEEIAILTKGVINEWIDHGGDILELVSRFIMGRGELLDFHARMHKTERESSISSLTLIFMLLKVIHEDVRISVKYKAMLMKEVKTILGEEYDISFLKMGDYYVYEEIVEKLEEIISRLHMESHDDVLMMLLNQPQRIIIDGVYDSSDEKNFNQSVIETLSFSKVPEDEAFYKDGDSMSVVDYKFLMIPWHIVNVQYERFKRRKEDFTGFKKRLTETWIKMNEVGGAGNDNL
ncbi:dsDNA nuclease domain-containing protein [Bacillus wiedmannii]|uniref:dsDNA nuclease domain-containing protein n=1 Tax=Bacillus wiedmannii TaxID=1890302 RepID=UPI0008640B8A|nr:dsDNA nuclease domain-containing protein [Bacillus wiedmannii]SCN02044.1 Uncharacterized protein BCINRASA_01220 [Bacillus wiedmannii]